ncbi:MAG: hypothetical protein HY795_18515 [Desulfovibrio sp.]|nr:hypothetical protein [Desulfovibrio sp.]
MKKLLIIPAILVGTVLVGTVLVGTVTSASAGEILVKATKDKLGEPDPNAKYWEGVPIEPVTLMAQPMAIPRPASTTTPMVQVQAVHDGRVMAVRLRWADADVNEAGRLGEYSDAAAMQFPVKAGPPPPVFMGAKDLPVHIFHWRAQYQRDKERGKPTMRDLYPNMSIDIYPMEFRDPGSVGQKSDAEREKFSPGRAEGNPQAYEKTGVDEILAEGFSTSSVQEGHGSLGRAVWVNGEWLLVITRQLMVEGGSTLTPGGRSFAGFAVWQGGNAEVGSRKCVTMSWTPVLVEGGVK